MIFAPTSVWNAPLQGTPPIDPASGAIVSALASRVAAEQWPGINTTAWSVPLYVVPAGTPTVKVAVDKPNSSGTALQAAWNAVPLPAKPIPAMPHTINGDDHLVVYQPSTDKMWEFWRFTPPGQKSLWSERIGPCAVYGGAMEHVSTSQGFYSPVSWPGATTGWGASGSSLPMIGGLITVAEARAGVIPHALAMAVPNSRAVHYALPAQRTDGKNTEATSIPFGAHFRLPASYTIPSTLPKFTQMLARAAQQHGIIVRDTSAVVTMAAEDPTQYGSNPWPTLMGASPSSILHAFPWSHLQLLKMEER